MTQDQADRACTCAMTEGSQRRCPQHGEDQYRTAEKGPFGPIPGTHRNDCAWTLHQQTCSCEYPRYIEAVERVASDLVRRAVEDALENEDPGWEDYPDLPEFVWDDVRDRARRLAATHTDLHSSDAYKALAALATEEAC